MYKTPKTPVSKQTTKTPDPWGPQPQPFTVTFFPEAVSNTMVGFLIITRTSEQVQSRPRSQRRRQKLIQQNISKWKASWGRYTPSGYSTPLWCFLRRFLVALEIIPKPPIPWLLFSTKWIKLESCEIVQQRILNFMNMGTPDLLHSSTLTSLIIRPGPQSEN